MFIKSAASDTPQGKAIQAINEKWGEDFRRWNGRETIGIPVCKKKYTPFSFKIVQDKVSGAARVTVERMFGCHCHSAARKQKIELHGCRTGWEPLGQWSMRKALEMAKREAERINDGDATDETWSSDDEKNAMSICNNGNCMWKLKRKFDNVHHELTGKRSDDDFERFEI
jgi:hypothetical protein